MKYNPGEHGKVIYPTQQINTTLILELQERKKNLVGNENVKKSNEKSTLWF
jgi:hypothetical protein